MSKIDNENPEWTRDTFRRARPASEALAQFDLPKPRKGRGLQKTPTKVQTTIRLDSDVVAFFKKKGSGWQSRINDALRDVVERRRSVKRRMRA
jgi:uncharacterized protein (DUF4415 family)